jgi:hypothetical protein
MLYANINKARIIADVTGQNKRERFGQKMRTRISFGENLKRG